MKKKKELSDAIIAWMRYKRNVVKVPAYCTPEIEACIERWSIERLDKVVRGIELDMGLFRSPSCPFCVVQDDDCDGCEFGKINGECGECKDNLWSKHDLCEIDTTPANRNRFDLIFNKLKKEL